MEIFISYSWEKDTPSEKVLSFVDFLRKEGYEAKCDITYTNEETSVNFPQMMAIAMRNAQKVIVVLSQNYKKKADEFRAGVGQEYRYIISDIKENKKKYIFVSFESITDQVIKEIQPDFLNGYEIIDLIKDGDQKNHKLFSKLLGQAEYQFLNVNPSKKEVLPKQIKPFKLINNDSNYNEVYMDFIKKWCDLIDIDNWDRWASGILEPGHLHMEKAIYDKLRETKKWLLLKVRLDKYSEVEESLENFRLILEDFFKIAEGSTKELHGEIVMVKQHDELKEWNTKKWNKLFEEYKFTNNLLGDLILELTRACNYINTMVRKEISPCFRTKEGNVFITHGPVWTGESIEYRDIVCMYGKEEVLYPGLEKFIDIREYRDYTMKYYS